MAIPYFFCQKMLKKNTKNAFSLTYGMEEDIAVLLLLHNGSFYGTHMQDQATDVLKRVDALEQDEDVQHVFHKLG